MRYLQVWGVALIMALTAQFAPAQPSQDVAVFEPQGSHITGRFWGGVDVKLSLSQAVPYRVYTLSQPNRLVIDFKEVDWTGADADALLQAKTVTSLRFGPLRPGWSRLVAQLARPMIVDTSYMSVADETGKAQLRISLDKAEQDEFDARTGTFRDPGWDIPDAGIAGLQSAGQDGAQRAIRVALDPGHGGIDPGAEAGGVNEASLMLTLAREVKDTLVRAGYEVIMTRDSNIFISLEARVDIAHQADADVFISLHADALKQGIARGASVYTLSSKASDKASADLAERHDRDDLLSGLDLTGTDDRVANVLLDLARLDNAPRSRALSSHLVAGIRGAVGEVYKHPQRQAGFAVLKAADIPSVLIEVAFLSTAGELRRLQDPLWRAKMATGIRDGLTAWAHEDAATSLLRRQ